MAKNPSVEVYRGSDDQWYWRLKAANGKVVCAGEGYPKKSNALRGVESMLTAAKAASNGRGKARVVVLD